MADGNLVWGIALTLSVIGALGVWFFFCGRAARARRARAFAKATLRFAGVGFLLSVAFLTSDLGSASPEGRMGLVALTVCCFLLVYAAASALIASNDESIVLVNLTGRALLLTDPQFAPFYTLPAPREEPAHVLPPIIPRTRYVVSPELGRLGFEAGRTDVFTVDSATATDLGDAKPLLVRRLLQVAPAVAP